MSENDLATSRSATLSLGEIIEPAPTWRAGGRLLPILSMTMRNGLVDQATKFKKRVASEDTSPYKVVMRDQLVVGFPIDEGVLAFQRLYDEAIVSPAYDIWNIRRGLELCPSYLERYLRSPQALRFFAAKLQSTTARRRSLPDDLFLALPVPLPLPDEQRRIAAILDQADALRAKRRAALEQLDEMAQAIFVEMFGDPISNSKQWPIAKLGSIAEIERGKFTPRPRNDPSYYNGEYPFIQTGDISNSGGRLRLWGQSLNEKGRQVSRSFPPGTVVIAIVGATLGATSILEIEAYCPDSVIGLQVQPNNGTAEYVEHLLRIWRPIFVSQAPETARANMNLETLRPLEVPAPPVQLQRSFSKHILAIEAIRAISQRQLSDLDALFASVQLRAFNGDL